MPSFGSLQEPAVLVRAALGILLLANIVLALFVFHVFGASPQELDQSVVVARSRLQADQMGLNRSRLLTGNIEKGRYLGVMESMMEADATWARIRKEADIFASIYDPEVFTRHPGGGCNSECQDPRAR